MQAEVLGSITISLSFSSSLEHQETMLADLYPLLIHAGLDLRFEVSQPV